MIKINEEWKMLNAYSTTPGKDYDLSEIVAGINRHIIHDSSDSIPLRDIIVKEYGIGNDNSNLPFYGLNYIAHRWSDVRQFNHPLLIGKSIFIDPRPFTSPDRQIETKVNINNNPELRFMLIRASIEYASAKDGGYTLKLLAPTLIRTMARWIANSISSKKNLNIITDTRVFIIAAEYYLHIIEGRDGKEDDDVESIALKLSRMIKVNTSDIIDVIRVTTHSKTVKDLLYNIREFSNSTQLDDLTMNSLYYYIQGVWYGYNTKEILAMAIECPSIFATIIHFGSTHSAYKKTQLSRLIGKNNKQDELEQFNRVLFSGLTQE